MSDLMNTPLNRSTPHRQFLSTVSALALVGTVYGIGNASAASSDEDRPTLWIELGGQAETISGQGELFTAPFMATNINAPVFKPVSPLEAQKPPVYSLGEEGKISFQPEDSNWVFSASVRYGRSGDRKNIHQQTTQPIPSSLIGSLWPPNYAKSFLVNNYAQYKTQHDESHAIVDFQVGKDVGLGMFGPDGKSVFNIGIRYAQYLGASTLDIRVRPDLVLHGIRKYYANYALAAQTHRSFHGIGPSLSWNASVPIEGSLDDGALIVDWGLNAAILFGRQASKVHHQTSGGNPPQTYQKYGPIPNYHRTPPDRLSKRTVIVPNFGGFAGISYRFSRAAISVGYRADIFSGAIDGGIDAAAKSTLGFHGPFATVSVGIGG